MRVWIVTMGEPVPVQEGRHDRLHRSGFFARFLATHDHQVIWWTSTFDHFRKKQWFTRDTTIDLVANLRLRMLKGCGYRRNVSLARILDHRQIAGKFAAEAAAAPRPDVIVAALPTIDLCLASVRYGRRAGVPVVLDMRDMWPDIFVDLLPSLVRPVAQLALCPLYHQARQACAGATAITGITEEFVDWGLARGRRRRSPLDRAFPMGYTSVPPPPEAIAKAEAFWDERGVTRQSDEFVVAFMGTLGRTLALETVVEAARRLERSGRRFRFVFCGTGDRLEVLQQSAGDLRSTLFTGWLGAAELFVLMRRSSVGLDPMPARHDFLATINNKAIEYLSAGLPVVSSPDHGALFKLLRDGQCGLSYPTGNAAALAAILAALDADRTRLARLSGNAARIFEERFQAERVYASMMDHLGEICGGRHRRAVLGA